MKVLGFLLMACVVLAVIRAALAALLVLLAIGLVWSAIMRPHETARLFGVIIITSLVQNHGLAVLFALLTGPIFWVLVRKAIGRNGRGKGEPAESAKLIEKYSD